MTFKVGDCVILTEEGYEGRTGFVEEIRIEPNGSNPRVGWREGQYSIYSLNRDEYINGSKFYIGDTMGYNRYNQGHFNYDLRDKLIAAMSVKKGITDAPKQTRKERKQARRERVGARGSWQ